MYDYKNYAHRSGYDVMRHIGTHVLCTCCLFGHYHPSEHGSVVCTTILDGGCWEGHTRFHASLREEVSRKVLLISLLCRYPSGNKLVGNTQQKRMSLVQYAHVASAPHKHTKPANCHLLKTLR